MNDSNPAFLRTFGIFETKKKSNLHQFDKNNLQLIDIPAPIWHSHITLDTEWYPKTWKVLVINAMLKSTKT